LRLPFTISSARFALLLFVGLLPPREAVAASSAGARHSFFALRFIPALAAGATWGGSMAGEVKQILFYHGVVPRRRFFTARVDCVEPE
jgi:hypothetical protein